MAGKRRRGRPSVFESYYENSQKGVDDRLRDYPKGKTLANRVYGREARKWLDVQGLDCLTFDWVLERSTILYELGRLMEHLHKEDPDGNHIRFIRATAQALCEEQPMVTQAVADLRRLRLSGEALATCREFEAKRLKAREAAARGKGA
jgi:hypothetical protein